MAVHSERTTFGLLIVGGGLVWLLVLAGPLMAVWGAAPPRALPRRPDLFVPAWLLFGLGFWITAVREETRDGVRIALLFVQSACAIALVSLGTGGAETGLLVVVAGQAPFFLSLRGSLLLVAVQTLAVMMLVAVRATPLVTLWAGIGMGTFQAFAVAVAHLGVTADRAREETDRLNAELREAQGLLAESARLAERLRISRDLHDTLGHHLTVLSLNLEAASHLAQEPARGHVQRAQAIARLLLGEVRGVVDLLREEPPFDLGRSLADLTADVPRPRVHLTLPPGLGDGDAERARVLYRCVQEVVTNAARHSGAANLWIELTDEAGSGTSLVARDDGQGADSPDLGHGLLGMRERLEQAGGRLDIATSAGRGFELRAFLPAPSARA